MSDLIYRQKAIEALDKDIMGGLNYKSILNRLPSAEPERKTGKWIYFDPNGFKCSECGGYLEIEVGDVKMNFCPNCGSYNGGEKDDI